MKRQSFFNAGRIISSTFSGNFYLYEYTRKEIDERIKAYRDEALRTEIFNNFAIDTSYNMFAECWETVIVDKKINKMFFVKQYKSEQEAQKGHKKWSKATLRTINRVLSQVKENNILDIKEGYWR